jgi:hypothetical protein
MAADRSVFSSVSNASLHVQTACGIYRYHIKHKVTSIRRQTPLVNTANLIRLCTRTVPLTKL